MLKEIYKFSFVFMYTLAILVSLHKLSRGTYTEEVTPLGSGVGLLVSVLYLIGFLIWFW